MSTFYRLLFTCMAGLVGFGLSAQTYTNLAPYQDITMNSQTFTFTFAGPPGNANGMAQVTVFYQGDFGDFGEIVTAKGESGNTLGVTAPTGTDCSTEDSITFSFPADSINAWLMNDNNVTIVLTTSASVDEDVCSAAPDRVRVRLTYGYCNFPVQQFADFMLADSSLCPYGSSMTLNDGTPAGGTFSGPGVMGNTFAPNGLAPGNYGITYTATDAAGCTTSKTRMVTITGVPPVMPVHTCPGGTAQLQVDAFGSNYVWFSDSALTAVLDSGSTATSPVLNQSTPFYVAAIYSGDAFNVQTLTADNFAVAEHNAQSGDDRGGIAVTPNYLYVVGDNNTVRLKASDLSGAVSLPQRDGIFSDLKTGKLWTLWNTANSTAITTLGLPFSCNALRGMDSALAYTNEYVYLSDTLLIDDNVDAAVLAGYGKVGLYNGADSRYYIINIGSGVVEDLGSSTEDYYGSENWADWGILEYDGNQYSALYRTTSGNTIVRKMLPNGPVTTVRSFVDIRDMSSITFSPWHNRWYFHYENSSTQFGGGAENAGYAGGTFSTATIPQNTLGCYNKVVVDVNVIDLGPDQTICYNEVPVMLTPGLGYDSYTWNGDSTNYNIYYVSQTGTYSVQVPDEYGCTISDSVTITVKPAPATSFVGLPELVCIDGQDVALTGMPAGGTFSGTGVSGTLFDPTAAGLGAEQLTYTYTDADNCVGSATASVYVSQCLGVEESDALGSVVLFPNPATGVTNLQIEPATTQDFTLEVVDMTGKRVYGTRLMGVTGTYTHTLDVSTYAPGVYTVRLIGSEKGSQQIRFIKQ